MKHLPLPEKVRRALLERGACLEGAFLTGSRAFGTHSAPSDFDVCVDIGRFENIRSSLLRLGADLTPSSYNAGVVAELYGVKINLIPLHPHDMVCWFLATEAVQRIVEIPAAHERLRSRSIKHGLFEVLRGVYKASIPYEGAEQSLAHLQKLLNSTPPQ